ncbi:ANTAR domain-containing protein [Arthrobacter sp. Soc17.1.1.1]|uniref:ANTAR domain-containing protein n=1 Tax=Arthrobacter sp. Soc17.1.1.1 TaxID=3121277 RepID=UPI002FE4373E
MDQVGVFTYRGDTAALTWDEGMYAIHGYEPGDIVPALEVGFAHVEPASRDEARSYWGETLTAGIPAAWYYTLINARARPRRVLAVVDPLIEDGVVRGVRGFLIDITVSVRDEITSVANTAVARSAAKRAVIEQAKGVLLVTQGLGAEEAFARLNQYSQRVNRKVALLAQDILDATADPQILRTLTRSICAATATNQ